MRYLIFAVLATVCLSASGDVIYRNAEDQMEPARVIESNGNGILVEFNLIDLEVLDSEVPEFGSGSIFRIPTDGGFMAQIGAPDVPAVRRMVLVPATGNVELEIVSEETSSLGLYSVAPYQEPLTYSPGSISPYRINESLYNSPDLFPGASVELESVEILREIRVAWVRFNPVRVNPVTGEVFLTTSVSVRVAGTDGVGENELSRISNSYTRSFLPLYEQVLGFTNDADLVDGSYVFIGTTESIGLAQDLIDWKSQKGYDVQTGDLATIGTTVSEIDAWLENAYNTWPNPPEYIMLIGSELVVPTPYYAGSAADNQYAVVGTGVLPSMHIGRILGNDTDDLAYIAWKTRMHEMEPYQPAGVSWFKKATSMACTSPMNAAYESLMLHQLFMAYTLDSEFFCDALGGIPPTNSLITNSINEGRTLINYIGHGSPTSWVTSEFTNSDIAGLTNNRMLPWVATVGCQNGEFDNYYCFCEAWLSEGTIADPKGCLAIQGSSTNSPIGPSDTLQIHSFRAYFQQEMYHLGADHSYGKEKCIEYFGSSGNSMVMMAHLFGCPETDIYTDTSPIAELSNAHSTTISSGSFEVTVSDDTDALIEGAMVAAYYADTKELLDSEYTNASGIATLTIGTIPGTATVTITSTCHNKVPCYSYANTVDIADGTTATASGLYLNGISPNPIRNTAAISYGVPLTGNVRLEIYDITGRIISTVHSGEIEAGNHTMSWDGIDNTGAAVPNGVYFMRLTTPSGSQARSFMVLK